VGRAVDNIIEAFVILYRLWQEVGHNCMIINNIINIYAFSQSAL
jgi:hypothetical protein